MKSATALMASAVFMLVASSYYLAYTLGVQSVKCPPCIEQVLAACPPEDIYVNTAAGIMQFEKGEIDAHPPYIINQKQMDEMYQKLEQELLKQKGGAL